MSIVSTAAAVAVFFFAADLVYTLDHYFVHHDRERYRLGHARHHRRYNGKKDAPQLDAYEITTDAWHHSHPDDEVFTYSETWQGFDRILEWAHRWLVRYTKDGRAGLLTSKHHLQAEVQLGGARK